MLAVKRPDWFIAKSRVGGPLSKTFETDLPHSFLVPSAFSREKVKNSSEGYQPFYDYSPVPMGFSLFHTWD